MTAAGEAAPRRFALRDLDRPHLDARQVDGAWWPRTNELVDGVQELVADVARAGFAVRRIGFALDDSWTSTPRKLPVSGRRVRLGAFDHQPPHTITLIGDSGWDRLQLLVVPPGTPAAVAQRAIAAASSGDGGDRSASDILERAAAQTGTAPAVG